MPSPPRNASSDTEVQPHRPPGAVDARFTLAAERTVLAWIRTALGLIAAGVAVLHLVNAFAPAGARTGLGITLIATGAATAIVGGWRWRRTDRALRGDGTMPGPGGVWVLIAIIVAVSGVFAALSVV